MKRGSAQSKEQGNKAKKLENEKRGRVTKNKTPDKAQKGWLRTKKWGGSASLPRARKRKDVKRQRGC